MKKKYLNTTNILQQLKNSLPARFGLFLFAVLFTSKTVAQNSGEIILQESFKNYQEHSFIEKIYLHSDKDVYLAGEICWFKLYNVNAFFNSPVSVSKIAYVEVLDNNNKPVLKAKISLRNGTGNGSFDLPLSLVSGTYNLRAYTNWMKNGLADYFFYKRIRILNSRKAVEGPASIPKEIYDIQFFPEGGNLVNGIQSKIAFHTVDKTGKGISCAGVVINDQNDTLVHFSSLKFGMGNFLMTPQQGHLYKARVRLPNGQEIIKELPAAYKDGYTLQLEETGTNQLKITVRTTLINSVGPFVYLFAHTRGSVKFVTSSTSANGQSVFFMDKNKLGDGISHFTIFNGNKQPVCERLYFTYPKQRLEVAVTSDLKKYEARKKINLQISTSNQDGKPAGANMSMAVIRIDSLQEMEEMDISSYLWLSSDLTGTIESPGYYFNTIDSYREDAIDNLMLTHGWRRFNWERVLQNKTQGFDFIPEYVSHLIIGKIVENSTGLPGKGIDGFLSVPSTRTQFKTARSSEDGIVKFEVNDFYNEGEIIVQTNSKMDSGYSIEIASPFAEKFKEDVPPAIDIHTLPADDLRYHHIGVQVQNVFNGNKKNRYKLPGIDSTAFYNKADVSYLLDNYVRFTTLDEVLREYVPQVSVAIKNRRYHLPVFDELRRQFFEIDPLVLVDGVPAFDFDRFMNYDPLKIRKMEIVSRLYCYGDLFFAGIVNFITYKGDLAGYELDPHATVIDYAGLQLQREFYSPVYETPQQIESRLPDYRNLLYWSPDINTNSSGKQDISFYSSDLAGKFAVILQGITPDGKTGSKAIIIEVKEPLRSSKK
ncbi:MAG: hypothetical protein ACKVOW_18170 [Chitinophagaceae bacterium]